MTIAEQIYALVKSLPQDQASAVLTFAEFIHAKHLRDNQSLSAADSINWSELVHSLAGTWQEDFPDLDVIRNESRRDTMRDSI